MKHKTFQILVIICTLAAFPTGWAQAADELTAMQQEESARQLRIYRDSLLQGSTEQIRVDAAVGLLLRNDEVSRNALVSALKSSDNLSARQAVCKALIKSRGLEQAIGSRAIYLEPLMAVLSSDTAEGAVLAAEALLLYGYEDIEKSLEAILKNAELPRQSRLNAVYALQIRSEKQALARLVGLLDDEDAEISKAAETALQEAFGIPVGASRKVWDDILEKLKLKSPDDIRRELLLLKETKLRQVQAERDRWQKLYLGALDKQYEGLATGEGRTKMTLEMLNSDLAAVRVWALEKVAQYPVADNKSLRDKLLALLGDESRDVRLETAKVLNSMSVLDPAEQLLKQFKQEDDQEVRLAMFEALGEACFYAFSPGSEVKLSSDIKAETLSIAADYLGSEQADAVKKGAEVIRKILELNNLPEESINYYLVLISERYERAAAQNAVIRADLLSVMAHLCGQGVPRQQASKLFKKYLVEAMTVDDAALRLAALKGMVSVDPGEAMRLAKENRLLNDGDLAIRQVMIDLAGQVGGAEDLGPLLEIMNVNGQKDQVWQAIKRICQRQKSGFLLGWATEIGKTGGRDENIREILDLAEQKALGEKNAGNIALARQRLINWYLQRKAWDQGAAYLEKIQFSPAEHLFEETVIVHIFEIYLHSQKPEIVSQVIENKLLKEDFDESSPYLESLNVFLKNPDVSDTAKRKVFENLLTVKVPQRPVWEKFKSNLSNLHQILLSSETPEKQDIKEPVLPESEGGGTEN